ALKNLQAVFIYLYTIVSAIHRRHNNGDLVPETIVDATQSRAGTGLTKANRQVGRIFHPQTLAVIVNRVITEEGLRGICRCSFDPEGERQSLKRKIVHTCHCGRCAPVEDKNRCGWLKAALILKLKHRRGNRPHVFRHNAKSPYY